MNRPDDVEPYWQNEDDGPHGGILAQQWVFGPDIIAICLADAQLTNARSLALVGDSEAGACELPFSFSRTDDKDQFLDLVRSNEEVGSENI